MWFWIIESLSFMSQMRNLRARAGSVEVGWQYPWFWRTGSVRKPLWPLYGLDSFSQEFPAPSSPVPPGSSGQLRGRQRGFLATHRVASPCCIRGLCQRLAAALPTGPAPQGSCLLAGRPLPPGVSALAATSRGGKLRLQSALQRCAQGRIRGGVAELGVKSPL